MKKIFWLCCAFGMMLSACSSDNADANKAAADSPAPAVTMALAKAAISVPTIKCESCVGNVEEALKVVSGVSTTQIDLQTKVATVNYDESKATLSDLENAIAGAGYTANNTVRLREAYEALDKCCQDGGGIH